MIYRTGEQATSGTRRSPTNCDDARSLKVVNSAAVSHPADQAGPVHRAGQRRVVRNASAWFQHRLIDSGSH